jgi:hypothetical protein
MGAGEISWMMKPIIAEMPQPEALYEASVSESIERAEDIRT